MKLNVLFLCTGNSCRSIMAESLLRLCAPDRFEAFSAGTDPKGIHPLTAKVLQEIGIDPSSLRSKHVSEYLGRLRTNYVIVVCQSALESCPRIFPGMQQRLFWPFDDPPAFRGSDEEVLNEFRRVRDEIDQRIQTWVADLDAGRKSATTSE